MQTQLYITIILDSFHLEKTRDHHDIILSWIPFFEQIQVPIQIITSDTIDELNQIQMRYNSSIQYISKEKDYFLDKKYIKNKIIYGKEYSILSPEIQVYNENELVFRGKRINKNALYKAFFLCLDLQYQKMKKILEKMLT